MPLLQRLLDFTFALGSQGGTFSSTGTGSLDVSGFRASCTIQKPGGLSNNMATATIYGMALQDMVQLNTYGVQISTSKFENAATVAISAGDTQNGTSLIYIGQINEAYIDLTDPPNVALKFTAYTGLYDNLVKATPSSYQGEVKISQIMQDLANKLPSVNTVENTLQNDVTLRNPYKAGSYLQQMREFAIEAGIEANIDDGVLVLSTPGTFRQGGGQLISKDTGMIGSPSFNAFGIIVKTIFNPNISFLDQIQVNSIVIPATSASPGSNAQAQQQLPVSGQWYVYSLEHLLESQMPHGKWESTIKAASTQQQASSATGSGA